MKPIFKFKDVDLEGLETLETISGANRFNKHMFQTIYPFCKGKVLEIGSGIGNVSQHFIIDGANITLSDVRDNYCNYLKEKFEGYRVPVLFLDLVHPSFEEVYSDILGSFDTIFALNVVEHIENDSLAIANCRKLLKRGGYLIILVPAYQFLYNSFDRELFHYRRYTKKKLLKLIKEQSFEIKKSFYFNVLGILGWFVSGGIMKKKIIPKSQIKIYDSLLPITKYLDWLFFRSIGLSVVVVGSKK